MRSYDLSGMGPGSDAILTNGEELENYVEESAAVDNDDSCSDQNVHNQVELVRKLSLAEF